MKRAEKERFERLGERLAEIDAALADEQVASDAQRLQTLACERAEVAPVVELYQRWCNAEREREEAHSLLNEDGMRELARAEISRLEAEQAHIGDALQKALLPTDPDDGRNLFLEIRAGTGGDEAALFAGDLLRMYTRYAQAQGFTVEPVSVSESELGGYREAIVRIVGRGAYARLKFESGAHRVQRVPVTETQGRIHTSACTVAVLPEAEAADAIQLPPDSLRIDTFRASGAGGQHVNKTDSAVRITHLPSGLVVECQDDRSQHRNRAQAMAVLAARLRDMQLREQAEKEAATRKTLIGSGDRSERIRTYNFPQGRMTDHRINLTLYKLDALLQGQLDELLDALAQAQQDSQLAELAEQGAA